MWGTHSISHPASGGGCHTSLLHCSWMYFICKKGFFSPPASGVMQLKSLHFRATSVNWISQGLWSIFFIVHVSRSLFRNVFAAVIWHLSDKTGTFGRDSQLWRITKRYFGNGGQQSPVEGENTTEKKGAARKLAKGVIAIRKKETTLELLDWTGGAEICRGKIIKKRAA